MTELHLINPRHPVPVLTIRGKPNTEYGGSSGCIAIFKPHSSATGIPVAENKTDRSFNFFVSIFLYPSSEVNTCSGVNDSSLPGRPNNI